MKVEATQTWRDNDSRSRGRKIIVIESLKGRRTRILLERFNPNRKTGYTLVEDENEKIK